MAICRRQSSQSLMTSAIRRTGRMSFRITGRSGSILSCAALVLEGVTPPTVYSVARMGPATHVDDAFGLWASASPLLGTSRALGGAADARPACDSRACHSQGANPGEPSWQNSPRPDELSDGTYPAAVPPRMA